MKACTKCRVVKPFECFGANKLTKDKRQSWCKECCNSATRVRRRDDLDYKARRREAAKTEAGRQRRKAYMATEKWREQKKKNRSVVRSDQAKRRNYRIFYKLKQEKRVPKWVTPADTLPFYRLANSLGPVYTVDHIIPLRSKQVCGLHVPENLQVLTLAANEVKRVSLHPAWAKAGLRPA